MDLLRVEMTNFTNYADAALDLAGIGLAALVGQNGAGKSSIIDAFLWALFGEATKGGTKALDNYVRRGEQECRVAVEFAIHGERYRVIRQRSLSKGKTLLELYRATADGLEPISAKNAGDTQAMIERLLRMDYRTFTASSLILQGKSDSLTADMTDQERKEVLARILGLDLWDRLQEIAREKVRDARAQARVIADQVGQAQTRADRRVVVEQAIGDQTAALGEAEKAVTRATEQVVDLEGQLRQVPALRQQSVDLSQQISARERDREQASQEVTRLGREITAQEQLLNRRSQLEAELPEAERRHTEAKGTLDTLASEVTEFEVQVRQAQETHQQVAELDRQVIARERDRSQVQADGEKAREALRAQEAIVSQATEVRDGTARAAKLAEEIALAEQTGQLYAELDQHARAAQAKVDGWDREMATHMATITAQLTAATGQSSTLEQVPCGSDLQPRCPLLAGARQAAADAAGLQEQLNQIQVSENPHAEEWLRLCEERDGLGYDPAALARARKQLSALQPWVQKLPLLEAAERRVEELTAEIQRLLGRHKELSNEIVALRERRQNYQGTIGHSGNAQQALETLKQRLTAARQTEESSRDRLSRIRQALEDAIAGEAAVKERLGELQERVAEMTNRVIQLNEEIQMSRARQAEISTALEALNQLPGQLTSARSTLDDAKRKEGEVRDLLGRLKQELAEVERAEEEVAALRQQLAAAERQAQVYEIIDQATGKKGGVPALIVESAVPQIEALANDLLGRMAGGRLQIRLDTQAEGKSTGTMQEVLRITVLDGGVEGPYVTYSGAERFMVDLSLRIALSKFLAHRAGAEISLLVLDEGLGALDGANRLQVMAAIHEAAREFRKVLVITHIPELQEALPQRIEVTRSPNGSTIKTVA